jgi:hypothetical protein
MDAIKMAQGDSEALREGAREELGVGNRLQASLLYFLAGDRMQALELAVQDGGAYPLMETDRKRLIERLRDAKSRTDITYLARYYFGAEADIEQFMQNCGLN